MQDEAASRAAPDVALPTAVLDALTDPLYAFDAAGRLTYFNRAAASLSGAGDEVPAPGCSWRDVLPGPPEGPFEAAFEGLVQGGPAVQWDAFEAGTGRWLAWQLSPLAGGALLRLSDVSEHHAGEQARHFLESLPLGVVFQDEGGRISAANRAAELILGLNLAQLREMDSFDPRWQAVDEQGEPFPGKRHPAQRALQEGRTVQAVMGVFNPRLGARRWLSVTAVPQVRTGETVPHQVYTVFEDVTEARQVRQDLRRSEARYARLVEATDQYVWTNTPQGELRGDQPGWARLTGMTRAQSEGFGWAEALHPEDREAAVAAWHAAVRTGQAYRTEQRVRTASGEYRHYSVRGVPLTGEGGQVLEWVGLHSDITQLKQAEANLRDLNASLESRVAERTAELERVSSFNALLLDAAGEGIFGLDPQGVSRFVNPAAARILGSRVEDLVGQALSEMVGPTHPQDTSNPPTDHPVQLTLRDGQTRRVEGEVFWRRDGVAVPVEYVVAPVEEQAGGPRSAVVLFQDTSAREAVLRELRRSNEELEHFAYVASHDLQEPLRTVGSFAELLGRRYGTQLDERGQRYLGFIDSGVARMRRLIDELLGYARVGRHPPTPQATDLDRSLDRVLAALDTALTESGAVIRRPAPLPRVWADPSGVEQVLANLLSNAIKFRRTGEAPQITVSARRSGDLWRVEVQDQGIGIAPEHQQRIFGAFQRLHRREEYDGSGIGLAVVRKIVEQGGGQLGVESRAGQGSTFFFTLPALPGDT